jgi:ribosomal protein L24E
MDCSFCEKKISKGTEFIFVTKKGKAMYFCSSNLVNLERKPRKTKWTKAYKLEKDARLKLLSKDGAEQPQPKTAQSEGKSGAEGSKSPSVAPKADGKKTSKAEHVSKAQPKAKKAEAKVDGKGVKQQ